MSDWDSTQYLLYKNERTQPAIDLACRIPYANPKKMLDIGCGPGNSTQVLSARFPNAACLGIDNSAEMISAAQKTYADIDFLLCDAAQSLSSLDQDFDIVFSNACIQWIPNHHSLLREMMQLLRPGGMLAVQVPINTNEPIHKIICALTESPKWRTRFEHARIFHTLLQGAYYDLLSEISADFSMWETVYCHRLGSHKDIMEWYRGTGLRPYLSQLSGNEKSAFEQDVYQRICSEYSPQKNGEILFRFPRFFFIAKAK